MDLTATDVLRELKVLRKGFGFEDPRAMSRLGPAIRLIAGATDEDGPTEQLRKVKSSLLLMTERLPDPMAMMSRAALALEGNGGEKFERRMSDMACELNCDPRTVRRRMDDALTHLAEEAFAASLPGAQLAHIVPWHLEHLTTLVLVTPQVVEVLEERHIISHQDGLTDILHSYSLVPPSDHRVDVLRGGVQQSRNQLSATRTGVQVRLPHPLRRNQRHAITLRTVMNDTELPFYVCTPRYPCTRFDLMVRFATNPPSHVWLVDNELPLEVGDPSRLNRRVDVNEAGEATAHFVGLEANRSYGLGWSWPT